ncbi:hypothetical protein [Micromonospora lutea]|uniref:Uncharacterized protein n=1 Tax=Micromonospora lutea TaxID=419825 RepID=A0ABQ4IWE6_9ACTN|nr:hypothetical protein [Micromonospora lutea]GIJ22187.1 hypothetical protein Vlu01_28110 [Micromonospora lutea]
MARQGWGGSIATAAGVAAGAGAAQLGFGYGLGILNWAPSEATAGTAAWVASLIWATWIAATSTIFGAVCAQRLHDRRQAGAPSEAVVSGSASSDPPVPPDGEPPVVKQAGGGLWGVALAVAAGLGALITVLLVAVPARVAVVPDTPSPRDMAAGYAAVGVLVGTLVAVWALRCRAAATNVIATAGWLWLLAVIAVVDSVLAGRGLTTAQLGIWQLSSDSDQFWVRDYFYWPGAVLSLGSALVIGALAARSGVGATDRRVGATASGAAGPLLVAVAYFLAVPRLTAISPEQVSAHLIAPYAVIVGVGGSVLVAALAQRSARLAQSRSSSPDPAAVVPRQRVADDDRVTRESEPATGRSEPGTERLDGPAAGEVAKSRTETAPGSATPRPARVKPAAPKPSAPKSKGPAEGSVETGETTDTSPSVTSSDSDETPEGGRRVRQQRRGR